MCQRIRYAWGVRWTACRLGPQVNVSRQIVVQNNYRDTVARRAVVEAGSPNSMAVAQLKPMRQRAALSGLQSDRSNCPSSRSRTPVSGVPLIVGGARLAVSLAWPRR